MNSKLASMKISAKIAAGLTLFAILAVFITVYGLVTVNSNANTTERLVSKTALGLENLAEANEIKTREHQIWFQTVIENDAPDFEAFIEQIRQERAEFDANLDVVRPMLDSEELGQLEDVQREMATYRERTDQIPALWYAGNRDAAEDVLQHEAKGPFETIDAELTDLVAMKRADLEAGAEDASSDAAVATWSLIIVALLGLGAIGGFVLWMVRNQITRPLEQMTGEMERLAAGDNSISVSASDRHDEIGSIGRALVVFRDAAREKVKADAEQDLVVDTLSSKLEALAKGDLTADVSENFAGKYARLKQNYNEALAALRDLIGSVSESAEAIRGGAGEITQASEDLARRTESNAASLEETSASLTEVDGRVKATARAAQQTVERADQAIATVGSGRSVAETAVEAMERVSENAQDIDAVIEGLDKIAFQTRVLAMNAAVEAGRAGEAGRGFAVVADLVSALAMRAEEESKNAREQLTVTQTGIASAVEAVRKVDGALADISTGVGEVHELLGSMANDNQAQSAALTQVSAAIGDMDKATQQNAAMVEETSAAARNLSSEVATLAEQAARFKVGAAGTTTRRPANKVHELVGRAQQAVATPPPMKRVANGGSVPASDDWNEF